MFNVHLTLIGQPRSTQHCYKYTCQRGFLSSYMAADCMSLKHDYIKQIREQFKGGPTDKDLYVRMWLYMGNRRKADIDNFNKLVFDALEKIVYEDDKQILELHITKHYDKENPRVELTVAELSTEDLLTLG